MALLNQGADLVSDQAMEVVKRSNGWAPFGVVSAGTSKYDTGSHVDVHGYSMAVGLAYGAEINGIVDNVTIGAFFEHGAGNYSTDNSYAGGTGDTQYTGGGILGHVFFGDTGLGHFYTQVSLRAGTIYNDFSTSDLKVSGINSAYDTTGSYRALHAGLGYIWNISDKATLDTYAKYFLSQQDGNSVTLSTGDPVDFDAITSSRLRVGTRLNYVINDYVSPYVGVAWEHEFDGQVNASMHSLGIESPDLRGNTGIGEVGLRILPTEDRAFSLELGVQGFTGVREGFTGALRMKYEF